MSRRSAVVVLCVAAAVLLFAYWWQNSSESRRIQKALGQKDPFRAVLAYDEIAQMKPAPIEDLLFVLKEGNDSERYGVTAVFAKLHSRPEARSAIPSISSALTDPCSTVRRGAADCLGKFGQEAKGALPQIEIALRDSDSGVRLDAGIAYWRITGNPSTAVAVITNAMPLLDREGLNKAMRILGEMGEQAQGATPALRATLSNERMDIRFAACSALARVDPKSVEWVQAVVQIIKEDKYYRSSGIDLLGRHSLVSTQAMAAILDFEQAPDPELRRLASTAISTRAERSSREGVIKKYGRD